jgi:hypothetical protein
VCSLETCLSFRRTSCSLLLETSAKVEKKTKRNAKRKIVCWQFVGAKFALGFFEWHRGRRIFMTSSLNRAWTLRLIGVRVLWLG